MQRRGIYANISMNVFGIANVVTMQRHMYYVGIPMNASTMMNVATTQRRRCYINIPMNEFVIANVATTQRRRYYTNIPMNTSITTNVLISQLGTSCSFDSPGLARNEPTPGEYSQGDSTPSVLSFFYEGMVIASELMADYA